MPVRPSWDYPPCPSCETELLVRGFKGRSNTFLCEGCGEVFNTDYERRTS